MSLRNSCRVSHATPPRRRGGDAVVRLAMRVLGLVVIVALAGAPAAAQTRGARLLLGLRTPTVGEVRGGTLAVIDPAAGKIVGRLPMGGSPRGMTASADGKILYAINTAGEAGEVMLVVDVATGKETRRIPLTGSRPQDALFAGGKVYFSAAGRKAIGRYDPARNQTEWLSTGEHMVRMMVANEKTDTIFATSQSTRSVVILENASANPSDVRRTVVPLGHEGEDITMSPDGREIWTANRDVSGATIVDVASKKVVQTVLVPATHANRLAFAPDGRHVLLVDRDTGETIVLSAAARKEIRRIPPDKAGPKDLRGAGDVLMAPDGSRAFVTIHDNLDDGSRNAQDRPLPAPGGRHYLAVIDLKTLEVTGRIPTDLPGDEMAWAELR